MGLTCTRTRTRTHRLNESRAQRIVWLLEELRVPYDVEIYHRNPATLLAPKALLDVHPLGKSPVVTVTPAEGGEPLVLAESGFIAEYMCDHFGEGRKLVPAKWKEGKEGKVGGETEEWLRFRYLMHYAEGSFIPPLVNALIFSRKSFS